MANWLGLLGGKKRRTGYTADDVLANINGKKKKEQPKTDPNTADPTAGTNFAGAAAMAAEFLKREKERKEREKKNPVKPTRGK